MAGYAMLVMLAVPFSIFFLTVPDQMRAYVQARPKLLALIQYWVLIATLLIGVAVFIMLAFHDLPR
jgi:hypothetical protein